MGGFPQGSTPLGWAFGFITNNFKNLTYGKYKS